MEIQNKRLTLHLVLKRQWFEMIKSGVKTCEYREITPFWANRLLAANKNLRQWQEIWLYYAIWKWDADWKFPDDLISKFGVKPFTHVHFTLGYPARDETSRHMVKRIKEIVVAEGNPKWGAKPGKKYFVIRFKD